MDEEVIHVYLFLGGYSMSVWTHLVFNLLENP